MSHRLITSLWFDGNAQEAAEFYCSVFDNSEITNVIHYNDAGGGDPDSQGETGKPGSVLQVEFTLDGAGFTGINGGPQFTVSEATSITVMCKGQDEVDRYWSALTADGGHQGPCGWCKDKYGLSWQVVPEELAEILSDDNSASAVAGTKALYSMHKIDIAELRRAAESA